ncbi:MAG: M48 family metallopeptidase, partial [Sphingomonadaceae bacterium]
MDRIRNARHFAPRLQRWLEELATVAKPAASPDAPAHDGRTQPDLLGTDQASAPLRRPVYTEPVWSVPTPPSGRAVTPLSPYVQPAPPRAQPPAPPADLAPKRQLMVDEFVLEYTLRRSTRKSIGFMIDDDGLRVTAPKRISITEIDNAIRTKQHWILSKLKERRERRAARLDKPPVAWVDGAQLPYLGADITLRLLVGGRNRSSYNPVTRELSVVLVPGASEDALKERVKAWYQLEARALFEQRLDLYAAR